MGIGTNTPNEKLHVAGNIFTTGEIKPNSTTGQANQVLTSNGNGTMQWAAAVNSNNNYTSVGGFGSWGGCDVDNITDYYPVADSVGNYNSYFGSAVAISGDYSIVGAPNDNVSGILDAGSFTIFKRKASTHIWQSVVTFYGETQNGNYGYSVSISGNIAAVSDPEGSPYNGTNCGRVNFLYKNPQDVWSKGQFNLENIVNSNFGNSISLSGDYLIIGDNYTTNGGIAKIYKKVNTIWIQVQEFGTPQPSNIPEEFGCSVAIDASSNRFLIGARYMQKFGMAFFGKVK